MKSIALRSLKGILAVSSFFVLTGAKGEGCGGAVVVVDPLPEPPPPACDAGFHSETFCDDRAIFAEEGNATSLPYPGGECHDECVPDSACPEGTVEQWTCEGYEQPGGDAPVCDAVECGPAPECRLTCVPTECPAGSRAEWICEDYGYGGDPNVGAPESIDGDDSIQPPAECTMTCVSDECPGGTQPETFCGGACDGPSDGPSDGQCDAEGCWTECYPTYDLEPAEPG